MRPIVLHDTLSGELRPLEPREPGRVGIYACGPTVYAPIHVGNARPFVVFALLKRFLERAGHAVTLVVNITDVNDKIYDAARARGVPSEQLAEEMTALYLEETGRLGLGRPDHEPRAAHSIARIVELIEALIGGGHAYPADGDVYFRVRSFDRYGRLSNRALEEMDQGEDDRAGPAVKEDPADFALWKAHKPGEDTAWDAPWGRGRPGWHIECSAMAEEILGLDFEVHGGGSDLIFPHHENEIAQTEAARGRPLARLWMHNGMVRLEEQKMSKSVGNITLLGGALEQFGRDALVMYFASGHYRQPLSFSAEALGEAARSVRRLRDFVRRLDPGAPEPAGLEALCGRFLDALADDFNTPAARAALFEWVSEGHRRLDAGERLGIGRLGELLALLGMEGLLEPDAGEGGPGGEAERLLEERQAARAARDFETADRRREELERLGWTVRDTPAGPELVPEGVILYGRNAVREALRGRRRVRRVWATPQAAREPWLPSSATRAGAAELEALCGSPDHQGVCAEGERFPYADPDALLAPADALVVCLDQVQDPRNLGAVARVAECAGASGLVIPERRAAEVTAVACKASAGAVEHLAVARVGNLADWLVEAKRSEAWVYGAAPAGGVPYGRPDYRGRVVVVLGAEGRGLRPRVAATCDELIALPLRGRVGSLNVSAAAAAILYGILQFREREVDTRGGDADTSPIR